MFDWWSIPTLVASWPQYELPISQLWVSPNERFVDIAVVQFYKVAVVMLVSDSLGWFAFTDMSHDYSG
jgi:hypothetical protein